MDPMSKNILPLENALVPYQPEKSSDAQNQPMDFYLLELLSDYVEDEQLVLAAMEVGLKKRTIQ